MTTTEKNRDGLVDDRAQIGSAPQRTTSDKLSVAETRHILPTLTRVAGRIVSPVRRAVHEDRRDTDVASSGGGLLKYFLLFVVAPALFTFLNSAFFASDIYVVEAKLTVREAIDPSSDVPLVNSSSASSLLGSLGISKSTGTAQDAMIILDYVKSRAVIKDIGGREFMNQIYNHDDIDFWSRLGRKQDIETLWAFWRDHVTASVDTQSNILTLKVMAFTPQDALDLSNRIVQRSELLINKISERNRQDALKRASDEVERSITQFAAVRTQILNFQRDNNTLDPVETAKQVTELLASLSLKKIEIESRISASARSGANDRPADRYARTQLDVLKGQIDNLNKMLTGEASKGSVSEQLRDFEILKLRHAFAEQVYTLARTSFEDARRKLDKQQLYAVVVVPPMLPEEALYPRPVIDMVLVFFATFIVWAILSLLMVGIKDST